MADPTLLRIRAATDALFELLRTRTEQWGDAALQPLPLLSSADREERLRVLADTKLCRVSRGTGSEDDLIDLAGYLILLLVVRGYPHA
jgi:hypothetical protein